MIAHGITWAAIRIEADELEAMARFARSLGLAPIDEGATTTFVAADGAVIEFCGPDHPVPGHLFERQDVVWGVRVDDAAAARDELAAAGVELVGDLGHAGAVRYQHVRGPDGRVYGVIQEG
jgi:hypothetical protein